MGILSVKFTVDENKNPVIVAIPKGNYFDFADIHKLTKEDQREYWATIAREREKTLVFAKILIAVLSMEEYLDFDA